MAKLTLSKFERDLIKFIKSHPYVIQENANPEVTQPDKDSRKISLHTVDGDYERIEIDITYIA